MKTHDVKHLVARYVKKFETRDPFELAEHLNVEVQTGPWEADRDATCS